MHEPAPCTCPGEDRAQRTNCPHCGLLAYCERHGSNYVDRTCSYDCPGFPRRIVSISNPLPPSDAFRTRVREMAANADDAPLPIGVALHDSVPHIGGGHVVSVALGAPTRAAVEAVIEEERERIATMHVPTVGASEAIDMQELFGDELGDLTPRDLTSPPASTRAKARAKRKRRTKGKR